MNLKFVHRGTIVSLLWHRKLDREYHGLPWDVYDKATKSVVRRTLCLRGINRRSLINYLAALTVSVLTTSETESR